ncbi:MAG: PAS domain-containing protein, partial [Verrucomicrobiota bacterium]
MDSTNPVGRETILPAGADDLFRALFAANPDAVLVTSGVRRILAANPAAERLFGREAGGLVGSELGDWMLDAAGSGLAAAADGARHGS